MEFVELVVKENVVAMDIGGVKVFELRPRQRTYRIEHRGCTIDIAKHNSEFMGTVYNACIRNIDFEYTKHNVDEHDYDIYEHPEHFKPYVKWTWNYGWDYAHPQDFKKETYLWTLEKVVKDVVKRIDAFVSLKQR